MAASVTPDAFRRLALAAPGAAEGSHMGHADFRIRGKVFASLGYPDAGWAMVKLRPEQQEVLLAAEPEAFVPAAGAWGRRGNTLIRLAAVDAVTAADAIRMAWEGLAR
jgi:hypothetical protein